MISDEASQKAEFGCAPLRAIGPGVRIYGAYASQNSGCQPVRLLVYGLYGEPAVLVLGGMLQVSDFSLRFLIR